MYFAAWDIALAQSAASARHFLGLTSEQSLYNLAVRAVEMELIPALRAVRAGYTASITRRRTELAGSFVGFIKDPSSERVHPWRVGDR